MLAKIIAWGENREEARQRLLAMLNKTHIAGLRTNLSFLRRILAHPAFARAELDTGFIPRYQTDLLSTPTPKDEDFWQAAAHAWLSSEPEIKREDDLYSPWSALKGWRAGLPDIQAVTLINEGEKRRVVLAQASSQSKPILAFRRGSTLYMDWQGETHALTCFDPMADLVTGADHGSGLIAPMNGSIVRVLVEPGQRVEAGTPLVVLEAMKMEHTIRAHITGTVKALLCHEGDMVSEGTSLVDMEENDEAT
jgi:3-methylcrotonyl-CoA carboxylase alpha subunit